jgi:hypothetical protein
LDRPRAHWIETLVVAAIVVALLVVFLSGCTVVRGDCSVIEEVRVTYTCHEGGRAAHVRFISVE